MPKLLATEDHVESAELFLERAGIEHLRVRKYGQLVILESGSAKDPDPRVRFRRDTVHLWTLEFAAHGGQWEKSGHRDQLRKLLELVTTAYPWTIEPLE